MSHQDEVLQVVSTDGMIIRKRHRELTGAMDWLLRRGRLVPLLPGVYVAPVDADRTDLLARAVTVRHPDAVVVGAAAARLTFWPKLPGWIVEVAAPTKIASRRGLVSQQRCVPPELVMMWAGIRCSTPALTALDLVPTQGWRCHRHRTTHANGNFGGAS